MRVLSMTLLPALMFVASASPAQVSSYETDRPARVKGDSDKIVCQKEERIGTRLGAKKMCLTVSEWNQRAKIHREQTERMQMGVCVPGEGSCNDRKGEPF
ncbi:MAG: hypothetical protein ACLGHC_04325 [Alphaproteobacteria bacterium]